LDEDDLCVDDAEVLQEAEQFLISNEKCQQVVDKRKCKGMTGTECDEMKERFKIKRNTKVPEIKLAEGQICAVSNRLTDGIQATCKGDSGGQISFAFDNCLRHTKKERYEKCRTKYDKDGKSELLRKGSVKPNTIQQYQQYQLHGLTSSGLEGCGQIDYPDFYTGIQSYVVWIRESIGNGNLQSAGGKINN